jgi:hypothetical protein
MKLKSLAVITLVILGCSAAFAQTSYSFGFLSASGVNEYCNYESFIVGPSTRGNFYLQGYDVLSACPYSPVPGASINGFAITVPATAFSPVSGKSYVYSDQLYDAYYGTWTGEQWTVLTRTAVNKLNKFGNWNWAGYVGFFGYEFLGNYGFLSDTIPDVASKATNRKSSMSVVNKNSLQPIFKKAN